MRRLRPLSTSISGRSLTLKRRARGDASDGPWSPRAGRQVDPDRGADQRLPMPKPKTSSRHGDHLAPHRVERSRKYSAVHPLLENPAAGARRYSSGNPECSGNILPIALISADQDEWKERANSSLPALTLSWFIASLLISSRILAVIHGSRRWPEQFDVVAGGSVGRQLTALSIASGSPGPTGNVLRELPGL